MSSIFNPLTGNFVSSSARLGTILKIIENHPNIESLLSKCPSGKVYNPLSEKCLLATTKEAQAIMAAYTYYLNVPINERGQQVEIKKTKKSSLNTCSNFPPKTTTFKPQPHQKRTRDYYMKNKMKAMVLKWGLGTGKSCGSALIVDALLDEDPTRQVYILTSGSTRENYKKEYCMICGEKRERLENFIFLTYNYSMFYKTLPSREAMEHSIIVIDEFHNIIDGYLNESENYNKIYELLTSLKDSFFIFMTGTLLLGRLKELYTLITILDPPRFKNYEEFKLLIRVNEDNQFVPSNDLIDILEPYISNVKGREDAYPEIIHKFVTVPMSEYQYRKYQEERRKEVMVPPPDKKIRRSNPELYKSQKTRWFLANTMLKSQSLCNMIYPQGLTITDEDVNDKSLPDKLITDGGWVDETFIKDLLLCCPKFFILVEMIRLYPGKHIVFTRFVKRYGMMIISAILKYFDIKHLIFSGSVKDDEERSKVIEAFNNDNNLNGEQYQVLIFTKAGSEGQNLFQVRVFHGIEQYIKAYLLKQAEARGIRYGSHSKLPENMRSIVLLRYFALTPGDNIEFERVPEDRKTSDFFAYDKAIEKQFRIQPLIDLLDNLEEI
jgi:hypothetical protein